MEPRLRRLLVVLAAMVAILAGLWWLNRPAPLPVSLVVATTTRCVVDLVDPPAGVTCAIDGQAVEIPGRPTRWFVVEARGEATVAGWATGKDQPPAETATLVPRQASRVAAWPDREQPDRIGISTAHGYGGAAVAHQGSLAYQR